MITREMDIKEFYEKELAKTLSHRRRQWATQTLVAVLLMVVGLLEANSFPSSLLELAKYGLFTWFGYALCLENQASRQIAHTRTFLKGVAEGHVSGYVRTSTTEETDA